MISLGYVTAMWGRHDLTQLTFAYVARLRAEIAPLLRLELACAGSEGEKSREIAESNGFAYIHVPNPPLGAKWNAALSLLQGRQLEGVCVFGSDDIASSNYYTILERAIQQGYKLAGVRDMYFLDLPTGRILHWLGYPSPQRSNDTAGA